MRTSILIAGWSLVLLLLPVERAAGQLPKDRPGVFFSPNPNVSPDEVPDKPLRQLNLRPNQEAGYFVYVHNPLKDKATVKVQLVSGPAGKLVVAAEKTVDVPGKQTVRVPLVADKAQLPPALPPAIGPDGKPVPASLPAIPLGASPFVRAQVADPDGVIEDKGADITRLPVSDYALIAPSKNPEAGKLKIAVSRANFTEKNRPLGRSVAVKLTPRKANGEPIDAAKLAVAGNVLEGALALADGEDGAETVELVLNTAGLDADGFADVSIDGYARAQVYTFKGDAPKDSIFLVSAPAAAIPGKPITVRLMSSGGNEKTVVIFSRTGAKPGDEVRYVESARDERTRVRIGENGEAVFVTKAEDWSVEFATQGVFGSKQFFARRGATESIRTTVKFDATRPALNEVDGIFAEPIDPKKPSGKNVWFAPGQDVRVVAIAKDAESGINPASVVLYMGEKPGADGKAAPGTQVKPASAEPGDRYTAVFRIPAGTNVTELRIGAIFANEVGLIGGGEAAINVDITPPEVSVLKFYPPKEPLASFKPGDTVRLIASAVDPESGIDPDADVVFFLGDPPGPDGKDVQTTYQRVISKKGIKAEKAGEPFRYAADLTLPKDIKKETEVKVGVMFKNRAGQFGTRVATVKLDKDFTTATLTVKVTQGSGDRRQPGIKVWLIDQSGVVAAEGKTDECGIAVFEKVLPGTYLVWGVKEADQNAQDYKTVVARGGDEIDVDLSVRRQLSPPIQPPKQPQR